MNLAEGTEDDPDPTPCLEEESKPLDSIHLSDEDQREEMRPNAQASESATEKGVTDEGQAKSPSGSRHSSLSESSQHGERPDSPITSLDEDAKDRLPIPRRPSAKVQESVEPLDEPEKEYGDALTVPDPPRGRRRSIMSTRSARTDDASDFGDFEDAQSVSSAPQSRRPSYNGSPRPPSSKAVRARSLSRTPLQRGSVSTATPTEQRNTFHDGAKVALKLKFTPDFESVDKLFDVAKLDAEQPATKDYSLDYADGVIKDNFTSISERKTWWRISRNGTMRMHDSGDDDNYRRITWATSKTREETNKIVRRWMEQGSYPGGQQSFGDAVSVKGGAFNWNSRVEPLSMDQVFGKRKSTQILKESSASAPRPLSLQPQPRAYSHSRNLSAGVKSLPPRSPGVNSLLPRSPGVNSLPPPSPLGMPAPPKSPAFGWSTVSDGSASVTPASTRPPSRGVRQSIEVTSANMTVSKSSTASVNEPASRNSLQLAPPSVSRPPSPEKPKVSVPEVDDDDDDDEWGEMVASPPSTSRPVSGLFDVGNGTNGSIGSPLGEKYASPAPANDTSFTLDAVSSELQRGGNAAKAEATQLPPAAPAAHTWDFSAFDRTSQAPAATTPPMVPAIPPTITSKPEFEFDTPLQSPTLSGPSRTASPISAFQLSKPSTPTLPTVLSRSSSIASFQPPQPPTPTVPLQPLHASKMSISSTASSGSSRPSSPATLQMSKSPTAPIPTMPQHTQRSSLSMGRPSPLQRVLTPKSPSPQPMSPAIATPLRSVSFAAQNDADESLAVRQVVDGLPDLSYMLR